METSGRAGAFVAGGFRYAEPYARQKINRKPNRRLPFVLIYLPAACFAISLAKSYNTPALRSPLLRHSYSSIAAIYLRHRILRRPRFAI
jgi:hypothetical protein